MMVDAEQPGGACTHWKSAALSRRTPGAVGGRGADKRTVAARTARDARLPEHDESAKDLARRKIQDCMIHSGEPMTQLHIPYLLVLSSLLLLGGCASRPINPPITHADPSTGYRLLTRPHY